MSSFVLLWVTFYRDSGESSDSNHPPEFHANDIGPCEESHGPMLFASRSTLSLRTDGRRYLVITTVPML